MAISREQPMRPAENELLEVVDGLTLSYADIVSRMEDTSDVIQQFGEELQSALTRIETIDTALGTEKLTRETETANLRTKDNVLQSALNAEIENRELADTGLDGQITTLESEIASIDARVTALETEIASLDARVTALEG